MRFATPRINPVPGLRLLACLLALCAMPAMPETFPDRPVQIVVPFPAGTASDVTAREVANQMSKTLKQQVVIINKPGAGGLIGTQFVAHSAPDGYTLLAGSIGTHIINPVIYRSIKFDPFKDFEPISRMVSFPNVLVVPAPLPVKNLAGLIALAKSRSKEPMTYGTGGNGTTSHIAAAQFEQMVGVKLLNIPYQGTTTAVTEAIAGRIDMVFGNLNVVVPFIKTGALRPLAIGSARRSPLLPEVPTFSELGYPQAEMSVWSGLLAPAGTPADIAVTLNHAVRMAVQVPSLIENFRTTGAEAESDASPQAFAAMIKTDSDKWTPVIKSLGIKLN